MQTMMGTIGAPNSYDKKTKVTTLNVARRIVHDPRMKNSQAFSNNILRQLEKIAGTI